ncbi:transposase [Mycobacterium heckeshornense]|nr:transposase [Mycobacterium heckeshornense]
MAGRKRHSTADIVRKLRRADALGAAGKTGEEITGELKVSPPTLYNWRRTYGGMDTDATRELKELREQNAKFKRLPAEAKLERMRCGRLRRQSSKARPPRIARWTCSKRC